MSLDSHLVELKRRHQALEKQIADAEAHPSTDTLDVVRLKRKKLYVKDQIARLSERAAVH
ncbi:MAG: DUF465 domain-containing protein [Pseudomonadota bacterium]